MYQVRLHRVNDGDETVHFPITNNSVLELNLARPFIKQNKHVFKCLIGKSVLHGRMCKYQQYFPYKIKHVSTTHLKCRVTPNLNACSN